MTDLEIAKQAELKYISIIANKLGLKSEEIKECQIQHILTQHPLLILLHQYHRHLIL